MAISMFLYLLFVLPLVSSLSFKLNRFGYDLTNIAYEGTAKPSVGAIEFNDVDYLSRVGWATYTEKVRIWDKSNGKLTDFSTHFTFIIDTLGQRSPKYGHGIAFFLSPLDFHIPPNSVGGFLGLFNTTTSDSSSNQILTIEFDSYSNSEWDPPYEHVGINNNSIASAVTTPWNASLHSGDKADTWIAYNSSTKNLTVTWSYQTSPNFPKNSSLNYLIDLSTILPEWVKIGFSAATGQNMERHIVQSWEFNSSLDSKASSGENAKQVRLIVGLTIPLGCTFLLGFVFTSVSCLRKRKIRKRASETENLTSINYDLERGAGPRRFSYKDLASATNNFSEQRKLGEGGFGCVYRVYLNDLDLAIAVKRISRGSKQGKKEYLTEIKTFSQLRHRNLVQLIGWCHDKAEFLLVYEFMPNGSLDAHLFGRKAPLTWAVRYKITRGLASALLYLHEEWEQCVVHRDIKTSNVMLDSSFNVKLGDFGLARLMDHELGPQTTGLVGTLGYMAPEYVNTGKASKESDVFSFGVVIIEIVTGKKSTDPTVGDEQMGLVAWVWDLYGKGEAFTSVDERLSGSFDEKQVECLIMVGLWCAHPDRSLRPSIRQAIHVLHFEASLPDLPTKMPVPMYHMPSISTSSGDPEITCSTIEVGR